MLFSSPRPGEEVPEGESARDGVSPDPSGLGRSVFFFVALGAATTALYLMFSGPQMRTQPKYPAYQAQMPPTPEGIVPVSFASTETPPQNPLPDTERTRATGRVYYGYYCAFCHGRPGQVTGPVGRSYVPAPTPLSCFGFRPCPTVIVPCHAHRHRTRACPRLRDRSSDAMVYRQLRADPRKRTPAASRRVDRNGSDDNDSTR